MNRFERSWELCKSSVEVLKQHKKLLLFPVVITGLSLFIAVFFFAPALFYPTEHPFYTSQHWMELKQVYLTPVGVPADGHEQNYALSHTAYVFLAGLYLVSMFVATFFNVAFYHEILSAFRGGEVSLGRGLRYAASRWQAILLWSLFAGLIGLLIRKLEEKFGFFGRLAMRFIGLAWSVASVFSIPILVEETELTNPLKVLRRSAQVLRQTWGETLIGYVGVSLGEGLVFLLSLLILVPACIGLGVYGYPVLLGLLIVAWVVFIFALSYVVNVAKQLFRGALYMYAAQGLVVEPYTQEMFDRAWKKKKGT
jgi:hypothetical protein